MSLHDADVALFALAQIEDLTRELRDEEIMRKQLALKVQNADNSRYQSRELQARVDELRQKHAESVAALHAHEAVCWVIMERRDSDKTCVLIARLCVSAGIFSAHQPIAAAAGSSGAQISRRGAVQRSS